MTKVSIGDAKAGMKLARPVTSGAGVVLMTEGAELTDSLISRFHKFGVDFVYVETSVAPTATKEERLGSLERAFSKTKDEPYMPTIKKALDRTVETIYSEQKGEAG